MCGGCRTIKYCSAACQKSHWLVHRPDCSPRIKKEKAKKAARDSGSGLGDMGSILNALLMPPSKGYNGRDVFNACVNDNHKELEKMVKQLGLDVNWTSPQFEDCTAARLAAEKGHDKCLSLLSQCPGVELSKVNRKGWAPIHGACQNGRHDAIGILVDNGVDANLPLRNKYGYTPAMICVMSGHVKSLAVLCDRKADPNMTNMKDGYTPAHLACSHGQVKCLQLLYKRGANINKKNIYGHTPLDWARMFKHAECIELLLANNATGMCVENLPDSFSDLPVSISKDLNVSKATSVSV